MSDDEVLMLRREDVSWTGADDGEIVVLDRRTSRYLAVGATGAPLWVALSEGATRSSLVDALIQAYEIDRARAETDVDAFLDDLRERDLI